MMAFGAKIKLSVNTSGASAFRNEIQKHVNNATASNPIKIKNVVVEISNPKTQISNIQKQFNANGGIVVKLKEVDASGAIKKLRSDIQQMLTGLNIVGLKDFLGSDNVDEVANGIERSKQAASEWASQMRVINDIQSKLGSTYKSALSGNNMISDTAKLTEITSAYTTWQQKIENLKATRVALSAAELSALQQEGIALQQNISVIQQRQVEYAKADSIQQKSQQSLLSFNKKVITLESQINRYIMSNSKAYKTYGDDLNAMLLTLGNIKSGSDTTTSLDEIKTKFLEIQNEAKKAGVSGNTFFNTLQKGWEKFGGWSLVTRSMMTAYQVIKDMVVAVKELDSAMTELKKVTDLTEQSYENYINTASKMSQAIGATLADTINATADFARLGYDIVDSAALAEAALVYKNVGDGIDDIAIASESLISTIKAFEQFGVTADNAMDIVDKFNEVGNNFAISSEGIGTALQKSAASLASANNTLDESIALITAMNSVIQNPEVVGTTIKTVSMYLRAAKTEAEEAGESTEGMANSVAELREELLTLTGGKVDIMIDDTTFKSTYQTMKELSAIWHELSDVDAANILELLGGKRNANAVAALLTNFEDAEAALLSASEAAGSATAENEKYLDSIAGKLSKLQSIFEDLSQSTIDSDSIKFVLDIIIQLVQYVDELVDKFGAMPTVLTAASLAFSVLGKNMKIFSVTGEQLNILGSSISDISSRFNLAKDSGMNFMQSLSAGFNTSFTAINDNISEYNRLLNSSIPTQGIFMQYMEGTDDVLAGYLKSLNGGQASLKGYQAYCKQAGVQMQTLGIKAKASAIGVTLLNTAVNMLIGFGIGLVIEGIVMAFSKLANATQEAIDKTNELNEAYADFKNQNEENISTLESMKTEFEELSKGVDRYGNNITLTANEYERYKEIVESVISISPSLSDGYDKENGYLVDKNNLLERAIELQEIEYEQELRKMTTISNLSTAMGGYIATAESLKNGSILTSDTDLSNEVWQLFRINDRDDISSGTSGDGKHQYLAQQIISALGIEDVDAELQKYFNDYGYFQWSQFWNDYANDIALNIDKIASTIDYDAAGFESRADFEAAIEETKSAATQYLDVREQLEQANQDVANQLKLVAENNDSYDSLSDEAKSLVSNFVDSYGVDDVTKDAPWYMFWKGKVADEDAIAGIKVEINEFIRKLTPEIQNSISGMFDLKDLFDAGDINVGEYQQTIQNILTDLESAGLDDGSINHIKMSLEISEFEEKLRHAESLLAEYDDGINDLTSEELNYIYEIKADEGSMTFDELKERLYQLKLENANMVNVLDFSDMVDGLTETKNGLENIVSAMQQLREGTALTKTQLSQLALEYPKLLEQANLFTDGSIEGQEKMLNSILDISEQAYDAQIDAKIAELKATEQVINDQLALETDKANIIAEIKNLSVNGEVEQQEELVNKMKELNTLQGQNYVEMQDGELTVNEEALNSKLSAEADYGTKAAENIWEPYAETITVAHTSGFSASLKAVNSYASNLWSKVKNIASNIWGALADAVSDAISGNWQGISHYFSQAFSDGNNEISAGNVTVTFDGEKAYVDDQTIDEWVDSQETASIERIKALEDFKQRTVNAYKNLESLKGLDLTTIYGSKTGSGSKSTEQEIKEYIADIDQYYDALKKLEEIQQKREYLEKKSKYINDPLEKIENERALIELYKDEADAERELMALKSQTIEANATALRALGFEVEYDSSTNDLYIKNLEHLNELTASSAGEYDSLQEATNALRKETEELIGVTEDLNDENIQSAENIENLSFDILEAKNNIVDYIEEIYDKQVEAYKEIIELRKEAIQSAKDEYDYESDIADKVKEIADLQARIDKLSLDDSREAQAERNSLMAELAEKNKELADTQGDHAYDAQIDALDKLAEEYESEKETELEILKNTVTTVEEVWDLFYNSILGKNVSIGESINNEVANAWLNAADAVKSYSGAIAGVTGVGAIVGNVPKYHTGGVVGSGTPSKEEVLALLESGEIVLNDNKQDNLYEIIDFQTELSKRLGVVIGSVGLQATPVKAFSGIETVAPSLSDVTSNVVYEPHIEVQISHNGNMDDNDARRYGEQIANTAIEKLYGAFERKGINGSISTKLKP